METINIINNLDYKIIMKNMLITNQYKLIRRCHEIFEFDDQKLIQKLTKLVALCPDCHMVKHIGLAEVNGNLKKATKHFMKVNKTSK